MRGGRVGVVAEPARVAAVALSALEGVADGGAAGGRAAVAAAALPPSCENLQASPLVHSPRW